jgi:hypothetical protein
MPDPRRSPRVLPLPPAHGSKGGGKTGLERANVGATVGGRASLGLSGHAASCPSPSWHRWLSCRLATGYLAFPPRGADVLWGADTVVTVSPSREGCTRKPSGSALGCFAPGSSSACLVGCLAHAHTRRR